MKKLKNEALNRLSVEEFKLKPKTPIVIILDNIRSLNNIGSVFRTADAFLLEAVYLCGFTAQPPHRDIRKTALGATESVAWKYFQDVSHALKDLRNLHYQIIAIEQANESTMLNEYEVPTGSKLAIIFGNEVNGVSDEAMNLIDDCVEIPQFGTKHSLNVSVSAGIVVWELYHRVTKGK